MHFFPGKKCKKCISCISCISFLGARYWALLGVTPISCYFKSHYFQCFRAFCISCRWPGAPATGRYWAPRKKCISFLGARYWALLGVTPISCYFKSHYFQCFRAFCISCRWPGAPATGRYWAPRKKCKKYKKCISCISFPERNA